MRLQLQLGQLPAPFRLVLDITRCLCRVHIQVLLSHHTRNTSIMRRLSTRPILLHLPQPTRDMVSQGIHLNLLSLRLLPTDHRRHMVILPDHRDMGDMLGSFHLRPHLKDYLFLHLPSPQHRLTLHHMGITLLSMA